MKSTVHIPPWPSNTISMTSAMALAAAARLAGASFAYQQDGTIVTIGLERLPDDLRREVLLRIDDVRAVIREHSFPRDVSGSDVADAARLIVTRSRQRARTGATRR